MDVMAAIHSVTPNRIARFDRVLQPSAQPIAPVRELTLYPAQFSILLKERFQGMTIAEAAESLGLPPNQFVRLLEGQWRPSKEICRRMGLKVVYALAERPGVGAS
jgi:hypothetical protein